MEFPKLSSDFRFAWMVIDFSKEKHGQEEKISIKKGVRWTTMRYINEYFAYCVSLLFGGWSRWQMFHLRAPKISGNSCMFNFLLKAFNGED